MPKSATELFRTPADIIEQVRTLATVQTDGEIARTLNGRWLRSGRGNKFTRGSIRSIRLTYGIASLRDHLRKAGWLTAKEMAAQLGVHLSTVKRFAREGVLKASRVNDKDELLFEPIVGPLPRAHPGKRFKDRRCHPQCVSKRQNEVQYEA